MTEEILERTRIMIEEEMKYARELRSLSESFRHPIIQALVRGIALDSEKHSMFYEAILKLLEGEVRALTEEEIKTISEGIRKHIETEKTMMELTKKLLDQVDDPKLKLILAAIHEDEVKHHKLLLDIEKNIAEKYRLSEEELWDMLWKDSPWHGAPGG